MALTERQTQEDPLNGTKKGMVATPRIAWVLLLLVFSALALGGCGCGEATASSVPLVYGLDSLYTGEDGTSVSATSIQGITLGDLTWGALELRGYTCRGDGQASSAARHSLWEPPWDRRRRDHCRLAVDVTCRVGGRGLIIRGSDPLILFLQKGMFSQPVAGVRVGHIFLIFPAGTPSYTPRSPAGFSFILR